MPVRLLAVFLIMSFKMKDYRQIDLNEWKQVGAGYNGQAFVSDSYPGMLLKISRTDMGTVDKMEHEFFAAKTAYNLGLPPSACH